MKINVVLEFDENSLGVGWMNIYNLELLLYSENATRKDLLKIISYKAEKTVIERLEDLKIEVQNNSYESSNAIIVKTKDVLKDIDDMIQSV